VNRFRKVFQLLLLAAVFFTIESAAAKIAVADLEKIFREFYKSRIAEDAIKQQASAYRKYADRLNVELQELIRAAQAARSTALNIALSPAEKQKAEQTAEEKTKAVRAKEAEIKLFIQERSRDMRRMEMVKRAEILKEIRAEISKRAAAEGYDFVFDCSGRTMNDQPTVLYYPERNNITNSVIRELNRTRTQPQSSENGDRTK
jgi:Skp family chaperone for outer membrane proteins